MNIRDLFIRLSMSFRTKTLSLQRAYFNQGFNDTLENTLRNAFLKLPKAQDRIVTVDLVSNQLFAGFEEANSGEGILFEFLNLNKVLSVSSTWIRQIIARRLKNFFIQTNKTS